MATDNLAETSHPNNITVTSIYGSVKLDVLAVVHTKHSRILRLILRGIMLDPFQQTDRYSFRLQIVCDESPQF